MANKDWKSYLNQLTDSLDLYLVKKAPSLPEGLKDFIVKVAPWLTLIGVVFGVIGVLALFGISAVALPFVVLGGNYGLGFIVSAVLSVVILVLDAMAISPLMKREEKGWTLLYYATLVGAVSNVITLNIAGLVIGTLLSLYILFQVRSYYK